MPYYLFENPKTGKIEEIFFHMNDEKRYVDEDGLEWTRIFTVPQASFDTQSDPYSEKDFRKVTNKNGTIGDLWDKSAEFSERRAAKDGVDSYKEKYEERLERATGIESASKKKKNADAKLKKLKVSLVERAEKRVRNLRPKTS